MTKIMLVEDDNNLREIYEARLAAEGFGIVSAQDGEAALALAAKERPDLIITDVMMPKISGFEMLDILRNTEGLKDVKVIMLTALGQAEDNARAGALGADRYLVKSQVTLEDIVKAAHDVVDGEAAEAAGVAAGAAAEPAQDDGKAWQPAQPANSADTDATPSLPQSGTPAETEVSAEVSPEPVAAEAVAVTPEPGTVSTEAAQEPVKAEPADDSGDNSSLGAQAADDTADADQPAATDTTADDNSQQTGLTDTDANPEPPTAADDDTSSDDADASQPADDSQAQEPQAPDADAETEKAEEAAEPASQEESVMRAQIDQFIGNAGADSGQPPEASLPDEDDTEYEKDKQTPDMGELSIHDPQPEPEQPETAGSESVQPAPSEESAAEPVEPAPATEAAAATVADPAAMPAADASPQPAPAPAAGYPSQPFDLPTVPDAAITPDSQPPAGPGQPPAAAPQPAVPGNSVVSDAINDMIASTPGAANPAGPGQPAPAAVQQAPAGPMQPPPLSVEDAAPAEEGPTIPPAPAASVPSHQSGGGSMHSRLVSPLGVPSRPDINQLLSMEEAKTAAAQAGAVQSAPPAGQPQPFSVAPPQPWQPQPPANGGQPVDPNSISL